MIFAPEARFFTRHYAERLVADIRGARMEEIQDSYAFTPIDQPERTADLIAAFAGDAAQSGPDAGVALSA